MQGCIHKSTHQNIKNNFVKDYYYINRKLVFKNSSKQFTNYPFNDQRNWGEKKNSKVPSLLANESRGMASRSGRSGKGIYSLRRVSIFRFYSPLVSRNELYAIIEGNLDCPENCEYLFPIVTSRRRTLKWRGKKHATCRAATCR